MSKLFHDMQDAARQSAERPANSPALAQLLEAVGADAEAAREATSTVLQGCRQLQMLPLKRPFLSAMTRHLLPMARLKPIVRFEPSWFGFNQSEGIRSVVVTSAEAGEGKTVSVLNLGIVVSAASQPACAAYRCRSADLGSQRRDRRGGDAWAGGSAGW